MSDDERALYWAELPFEQIPEQSVEAGQILESMPPWGRKQFLAHLAPDELVAFRSAKTMRTLFAALTPDNRANYVYYSSKQSQPSPRATGMVSAAAAAVKVRQPLAKRDLFPSCKLTRKSCYYTYQATLHSDRDGSPCTYGPVPCGSDKIGNNTPFCATSVADNYGCNSLPLQTQGVTSCPRHASETGVPLEHICNATNNTGCAYAAIAPAKFTSVVTNKSYPNTAARPDRCVTDSYVDPVTGAKVVVPVLTDVDGASPCIQQSGPGACDGVDCPCPGLYISQSAFRSPSAGSQQMNPDMYLNGVLIPYVSLPKSTVKQCGIEVGALVLVSAKPNPTDDPADWVAGILADVGGTQKGEVSYAMWNALGRTTKPSTFRVYRQHKMTFPITVSGLDTLKAEALKLCCPGQANNPCHTFQGRGTCITDKADPRVGECNCRNGWLPGADGDCTMSCPGSEDETPSDWTISGFQECTGQGSCFYAPQSPAGDQIGTCDCEPGSWNGPAKACEQRDCVFPLFTKRLDEPPCHGNGECKPGPSPSSPGLCICDEGWVDELKPFFSDQKLSPCTKKTCPNDCSGHGSCIVSADGQTSKCKCDVAQGWWGESCEKRTCITNRGTVCSGHGRCVDRAAGLEPACICDDEWAQGSYETGPTACQTRKCQGCPEGLAKCTYETKLSEWGQGKQWLCTCNDPSRGPPDCNPGSCCAGQFGLCNQNNPGAGAGICVNGACQCAPGYDPATCCATLLKGPPPGFGRPCPEAASKKISFSCPPFQGSCGSCSGGLGSQFSTFVLAPTGGGGFKDMNSNSYQLDTTTCQLRLTTLGPNTNGSACGYHTDDTFWLQLDGAKGLVSAGAMCLKDCAVCPTSRVQCEAFVQ